MYKLRQLNTKYYNEKNVNAEQYTLRRINTDTVWWLPVGKGDWGRKMRVKGVK